MNYTNMLNKIIDESGKMLKDIAKECQEKYNVKLTPTYLSNIRSNSERTASDDISRAIAKVCGAKYENILVVQAYLDKAPDVILTFLKFAQNMLQSGSQIMQMFPDFTELPNSNAAMQEMKRIQSQSLAEFICETVEESKRGADKQMLELLMPVIEQQNEPKWMVISPEQMKDIRMVKESDIEKIIDVKK